MRVTPGNVSFVHCGKSSIVISPYLCFISAGVVRSRFAGIPAGGADAGAPPGAPAAGRVLNS